jgi:hypothetical protein
MPAEAIGKAVFAVVVPNSAVKAATRVSARVRAALGIEIYGVSDSGGIQYVGSGVDPLE